MENGKRSPLFAWVVYLGLLALVGGSDLWTKQWVFEFLEVNSQGEPPFVLDQKRYDVVPGYFQLEANYNYGAFNGWFADHTQVLTGLSAVALVVITLVLFFTLRKDPKISLWFVASLGLIAGGTFGNLYDRWAFQAVRDWIKWYVVIDGRESVWPNFNIADAGICVGVAVLISLEVRTALAERREKKTAVEASAG